MGRSYTREMLLDPATFGDSKSCHVLVEMMNDNLITTNQKHRVLGIIHDAIFCFKNLDAINNDAVKSRLGDLLKKDYTERINRLEYPPKFKSFFLNVMNYIYRKYL